LQRTATMRVNPSPIPLGLSPAGLCSTRNGDCNRDTAKGGSVKRSPAYKTAGRISIKDNRKPIAGELPIPTAKLSSLDSHVAHFPMNTVKSSGQASCHFFLNAHPIRHIYHVHIAEAVMTELQWLLHVHAWMRVGHTARVLLLHGSLACQDIQDMTPV